MSIGRKSYKRMTLSYTRVESTVQRSLYHHRGVIEKFIQMIFGQKKLNTITTTNSTYVILITQIPVIIAMFAAQVRPFQGLLRLLLISVLNLPQLLIAIDKIHKIFHFSNHRADNLSAPLKKKKMFSMLWWQSSSTG